MDLVLSRSKSGPCAKCQIAQLYLSSNLKYTRTICFKSMEPGGKQGHSEAYSHCVLSPATATGSRSEVSTVNKIGKGSYQQYPVLKMF